MQQHASGNGGEFTSRHGFKKLRWNTEFLNIAQARECERKVKDFSRKKIKNAIAKAFVACDET